MNKTLVAIIAALLLTTAGGTAGAVATKAVTSKNIKDGTIKKNDLSKALRTTATSTYFNEVVTVTSLPGAGRADCPDGTKVVGGGFDSTSNSPMVASRPNGNGWYAKSTNFNENLSVYAICAK